MMNRGYTSKQMRGRGAPRLSRGMTPDKERREEPSGNTPAENVQGSRAGGMGVAGAKGAMSSSEGACAKAGGHIMGRGG